MKKIKAIRSGGQSGADRAAFDVARKYNIPVCGWCPKGGWAEDFQEPPGIMKVFPELKEVDSPDLKQRSIMNVRDADATLVINPSENHMYVGTDLTADTAIEFDKPWFEINSVHGVKAVVTWINSLDGAIELNVGGPRASECTGIYDLATEILSAIIEGVAENEEQISA